MTDSTSASGSTAGVGALTGGAGVARSDPGRPRRPGPTVRTRVSEHVDGSLRHREDVLATEEPMEIRLEWPGVPAHRLTVTMRTPGHDFELAAGLLLGDGLVRPEQVARIAYCTDETLSAEEQFNVVTVTLAEPPLRDPSGRYGARSSACGVCGSESLDQVLEFGGSPVTDDLRIDPDVVSALPERLAAGQSLFARTGGLHGAGLFRADGEPVVVREDVGRHNAVDKVVGSRALRGTSAAGTVLCVSGRVGFEICQKAVMAGVPVVVAVGAPSSLAVACAERFAVTVAGFTRDERFVVYAGEQRLGV